jgi:protein involved in polysaccharide export with SLBB domain
MLKPNRVAAWITLATYWPALFSAAAFPVTVAHAAPKLKKSARTGSETQSAPAAPSEEISDSSTSDSNGETLLAPGFLVQLSSGSDSRLNGQFRIQPNWRVDLPYNISVDTKGMSLGRFRSHLERAYAAYFNGTPDVRATIKQKRYWVEVLGLVAKPGNYLVKQDAPLDEIIAQAGGLTEDLANGYVRIVQGPKTSWVDLSEYYKGRATDVPVWRGADRIFFQKERPDFAADQYDAEAAHKVEVLGEVRNPGELTFRKEADVYYYLVKTGGPTSVGDLDKVEVVRTDRDTGERKQLSLGPVGDIKNIQGGDILIFHPVRTTSLERTLTITSIITSIVTASLLAYVAVKQANSNH